MSEPLSEEVEAPVGQDPTDPTHFHMRYPTLKELLRAGGIEGVEYCLVSANNLKKFGKLRDSEGNFWSPIRDLPALSISGPKGTAESVVLMGRGKPIPGACEFNGIRQYFVDSDLELETGLWADPDHPLDMSNLPSAEKVKDAPPPQGKIEKSH
jgi:hypothetical protein